MIEGLALCPTSIWQSVVLAVICKRLVRVVADVPLVRQETGYSLWVMQQVKVIGCCPGVLTLTIRRCFAAVQVDMLAVEVTNIQTEVWEHQNGRRCESQGWNFLDVNDLCLATSTHNHSVSD